MRHVFAPTLPLTDASNSLLVVNGSSPLLNVIDSGSDGFVSVATNTSVVVQQMAVQPTTGTVFVSVSNTRFGNHKFGTMDPATGRVTNIANLTTSIQCTAIVDHTALRLR
jgi:hypothetical protein